MTLRELAKPGIAAAKHNLRPILIFQALAVASVAGYYCIPAFQSAARSLALLKASAGLFGVAVATVVASIVIPELARRLLLRERTSLASMLFQVLFFALIGMIIDVNYVVLAHFLGTEASAGLVVKKVLADQFIFSPLVSIPYSVTMFLWAESGFSVSRTVSRLRAGEFGKRYMPLLTMCWIFWLPVLCSVFSLPLDLQFVLFLFAQAAWSLMLLKVKLSEA